MTEGKPHALWPDLGLDDLGRLDFLKSFRRFVTGELQPINRSIYEKRARPAYERAHGAPPADKHQVRKAMTQDPFFAFYVSARRSGQELKWQYCLAPTERQMEELRANIAICPSQVDRCGLIRSSSLPLTWPRSTSTACPEVTYRHSQVRILPPAKVEFSNSAFRNDLRLDL